ncbi:MAG: copper-translocating P-type ATPase [Patescibacteria group bacterium]|nr:copper-translocating P-type ATPase [Patescibacteria group bacterium]
MTYTCPMHPEIREDQPGRCPKCGMDLVPAETEGEAAGHAKHDHAAMMASPSAAKDFLTRFIIVTVLLIPLGLLSWFGAASYLKLLLATIIFYFGLIFFEHARHEIMMKKYGMMTLVSLAVGAGYLFSAAGTFIPAIATEFYLEISTLIWVLLLGHFLEAKSSSAAGNALQEVGKLLPKEAHLLVRGQVKAVSLVQLKSGDMVRVLPGEKVPADGVIINGSANFSEAHITGESKPLAKAKSDRVVAGAICLDGSVEVKLDRVGASSTIGQIQKLIASAQQTKPSAQRLADRAAAWLTFIALGTAIMTLAVWLLIAGQTFVFAMTLAITVLVIACPHALGLAIPTVTTIATKLAVANGVFIKDMAKLEVVKKADYVVFDKTGTLTKGEFGVTKVTAVDNQPKNLLRLVAGLENHSSHVIGQAIVKYAKEQGIKPAKVVNFKNLAGQGIRGEVDGRTYFVGNSALMKGLNLVSASSANVFVASQVEILGSLTLADQIKPEAKTAVDKLHRLGVKVAMLTGDSQEVAESVGKQLNIDTIFSQVMPEKKYEHIKALQDKGRIVIMVGDGVNDAPALTQANVGVAVGAGTDVAVEAGDVVLTRSNPEDISRLIVLARKVYRKMIENLIWALGYNALAIPAAAGVFIPWGIQLKPEFGAILMSLSSVIVVINAMSLRQVNLATVTKLDHGPRSISER